MIKRKISLYLKDIIEYMERAEKHIEKLKKEEFLQDNKTCDAAIRCIEVIGEATKNVPDNIRNKYPAIPWRDMAGMRDKIIHSYFVVDFENVWLVVKEEIPTLKPMIQKVLEDLGVD
ncbi:MAG: HepT-like ribonuclease domain-containing protein [Candidatus Heimdallarchaeaceae archaeon]